MTVDQLLSDGASLVAHVSPLEAAGALLGLGYVLLAVRKSRWCWLLAALSTALYLFVFASSRLYMQATLQVFYLLMSAVGWLAWRSGAAEPPVQRGSVLRNLLAAALLGVLSWLSATALATETHSAAPFADAATTWASVYATVLQIQKRRENWLWWIGIDLGVSGLCATQGLWATAVLYLLFVGLALVGWRSWKTGDAAT